MDKLRYTVFNEAKVQLGGEVMAWAHCPHHAQVVLIRSDGGRNGTRYTVACFNELSARFYGKKHGSTLALAYLKWQAEVEINCWRYYVGA